MKTVTLLTYHTWNSDRRAGFHHLAEAFHLQGWRVLFLTVGISLISTFQRDVRLRRYTVKMRNVLLEEGKNLYSYLHFTPWHSIGFPLNAANRLIAPLIKLYPRFSLEGLEFLLRDTDLFVYESADGLFLFEYIQQLNPHARMVYRVSDLLGLLRKHPENLKQESRVLRNFDYVSVPSSYIKKRFQGVADLHLDYHGINKRLYEQRLENPFPSGTFNAVWAGNWHFDHEFIRTAAALKPEWTFHIIGDVAPKYMFSNTRYYGEIPFHKTLPFICHAQVGLDNLQWKKHVESRSDSLKILQYTYFGLPIVMPDFLESTRSNVYHYHPGDRESVAMVLNAAERHPSGLDERGQIRSWDEIARKLAGEVWVCKPAKKPRGAFRKTPELSVVIPSYNSLHLLPKTLASLESQQTECKRFEVIVVDDGSTDGTSDWLKRYSTETPLQFHWFTVPNAGPGIARNQGAQEARAEWIGLLDADVAATSEWVSRALELIKEHPDAGAFEGRVEVSHPERASMFTHQTENLSGGRYVTCNLVLRRDRVLFHPGYKGAFREDSDLAFSIQQNGMRIYFDPALKVFHPPLPANIWNPLKLAQRYYFDALLQRRFPEQYKRLDAYTFLGITVPHLRKKLMLAFGAGQLLLLLVWLSQAPASVKGAGVVFYVLTAMAASLPYMRFVSRNLRPRKNLLRFAGVLHLIPWVLGFSLFHGKWIFRKESRYVPNRTTLTHSAPRPVNARAG